MDDLGQQPKFSVGDKVRDAYSTAIFEGVIIARILTIRGEYKYWVQNQYRYVRDFSECWLEWLPGIK